jgi:type II secretory pathway component PulC
MKQPFWILNGTLLFIFFGTLIFIFFAKVKIPMRQSIEPYEIHIEKKEAEKINLEEIYKNDLFNTSSAPGPITPEKETETKIPTPPEPVEAQIPETLAPQFFDPLDIALTGIIIQEDETKNKAIILDNKTKRQINYKVGDEIEDAQLIRILRNKVILVRSNGQQEILFLRQEDAKQEDPNQKIIEAKDFIKKISENNYIIDPSRFLQYVRNLGEFLEIFDLSTAYKQGEAIGSKVGRIDPESIAAQMGLLVGDIIEKINDISANNTDNRFEIYKKIISLKENDIINVEVLRHSLPITICYKIKQIERLKSRPPSEGKTEAIKIEEDKIEAEKVKIMKEKYQFAPTIDEIKLREKQNIFKRKK